MRKAKSESKIMAAYLFIMLLFGMFFVLSACNISTKPFASSKPEMSATAKTQLTTETPELNATPEKTTAETAGQKNALKSAKSYLAFSSFSFDGLVKQLEFEKYSHADAVYAAERCGADWNEQAGKSAKSYLEISSFSYEGLIQQLEYDGFTHEQAVYGAKANGY